MTRRRRWLILFYRYLSNKIISDIGTMFRMLWEDIAKSRKTKDSKQAGTCDCQTIMRRRHCITNKQFKMKTIRSNQPTMDYLDSRHKYGDDFFQSMVVGSAAELFVKEQAETAQSNGTTKTSLLPLAGTNQNF